MRENHRSLKTMHGMLLRATSMRKDSYDSNWIGATPPTHAYIHSEFHTDGTVHVSAIYSLSSALPSVYSCSFDEFVNNKLQDVIDEQLPIEILPEPQVPEGHPDFMRTKHKFKFGQVYLSSPQLTEKDGTSEVMRPMVARLRNLTVCNMHTACSVSAPRLHAVSSVVHFFCVPFFFFVVWQYCAPLFVDITKTVTEVDESGADIRTLEHETDRMALGKIPIMLQSSFCSLKGLDNKGLTDMGECTYDQGGYFVINGSEKVLVAQERMAANQGTLDIHNIMLPTMLCRQW
jgi:DNA-directed RNA polymerase beta subunit